MIKINNPEEFIKALEISHEAGDIAFTQLMNFFKRFHEENDIIISHEIGGSEKFLGFEIKFKNHSMYGGLLFDKSSKTWSSHT